MTLAKKLDEVRARMAEVIPPDFLEIIHRATGDLENSNIVEGAIKVGDTLPAFALKNAYGNLVRSNTLLGNGALVLTFFRGHW